MRVMISQPAGELTEERTQARAQMIAKLEAEGHKVWGELPQRLPTPNGVNEELWQLGCRLLDIATADAVYFMDGWAQDKTCRLEYEACALFGIKPQNACSNQLVSFTKFLLDKGQLDVASLKCDFCDKPASIIRRAQIHIDMDGWKWQDQSGWIECLCEEHAYKRRPDEHQDHMTISQFAEFMSLRHSDNIETYSAKKIHFIEKITESFLQGLKKDKIRLGKEYITLPTGVSDNKIKKLCDLLGIQEADLDRLLETDPDKFGGGLGPNGYYGHFFRVAQFAREVRKLMKRLQIVDY